MSTQSNCIHTDVKFHIKCLNIYHKIFAFFGMTFVCVVPDDSVVGHFKVVPSKTLILWVITVMMFRAVYSVFMLIMDAHRYLGGERNLADVAVLFLCTFRMLIVRFLGIHMTWKNRKLVQVVLTMQLFTTETHANIMHRSVECFYRALPTKKFTRWEWAALLLLIIESSFFIFNVMNMKSMEGYLWILIPGHLVEGSSCLLFAFSVSSWMKNMTNYVRMLRQSLHNGYDAEVQELHRMRNIAEEGVMSINTSRRNSQICDACPKGMSYGKTQSSSYTGKGQTTHVQDDKPPVYESLNPHDVLVEIPSIDCCKGCDDHILNELSELQGYVEKLDDIKSETIEYFSTCLTIGVLSTVIVIITDSFSFFDLVDSYQKLESLVTIFTYLCVLAVFTSGPSAVMEETDLFRKGLRKLFRCNNSIKVSLRASQLNECLRTLSCSQIWGFFELGNNILVPILSFVATYVIILLEMRGEPLAKYFCALNSTMGMMQVAWNSDKAISSGSLC